MDFEQNPQSENSKKALLIGGGLLLLVGIIVVAVLVLRQRAADPESLPQPTTNVNQPVVGPPGQGSAEKVWPPLPAEALEGNKYEAERLDPGLDRKLTDAERKKYKLGMAGDIWMKTSSPTDGSPPEVTFYDKSARPLVSGPDQDGDALSDTEEQKLGTDPTKPDSDGDGLTDYAEVKDAMTDPLKKDSDGDGMEDLEDSELSHR